MNNAILPLRRSLSILNTFFIPLAATFLLDRSVILAALKGDVNSSTLTLLILLLCLPIKIFIFSGLYGTLIEMASKQSIVLSLNDFKRNIKECWTTYFALLTLLLSIHFFLHLTFPLENISLAFVTFHLEILTFGIFIALMIEKKYCRPFSLKKRPLQLTSQNAGIIVVLYAANIALYYLLQTPTMQNSDLWVLPLLLSKYLGLFIFLYLAILTLDNYPEIKEKIIPEHEIYLVNPPGGGILNSIGSQFFHVYPSIFVVLKALSSKKYKFRVFNRVPWNDRYYQGNKLVAITCFTSNCTEAYKIAKEFRNRGSKVIMGGPHVTYLPDEALDFCDSVVIGAAEGVWKTIVKDYENGKLKQKYMGPATEEDFQAVHRELLNSPPEIIKDFIETTRGCNYRCRFCTIPGLSNGKLAKKDVEETVELLKKIKHKYKKVLFLDNNIYADAAHAKKLFTAIKPLGIKWTTQCTIDIAKNDKLLKLAKESGCSAILCGYETFGNPIEMQQGGKLALANQYRQFTKKIHEAGIQIKAHFIFGFESDQFKDLFKLWKFCFSIRPLFNILSILTPFPGSQVYYEMLKKDRILNLNWQNYTSGCPVFQHPKMNHTLLTMIYPFAFIIIFLTTSKGGHLILMFICTVMACSYYVL